MYQEIDLEMLVRETRSTCSSIRSGKLKVNCLGLLLHPYPRYLCYTLPPNIEALHLLGIADIVRSLLYGNCRIALTIPC